MRLDQFSILRVFDGDRKSSVAFRVVSRLHAPHTRDRLVRRSGSVGRGCRRVEPERRVDRGSCPGNRAGTACGVARANSALRQRRQDFLDTRPSVKKYLTRGVARRARRRVVAADRRERLAHRTRRDGCISRGTGALGGGLGPRCPRRWRFVDDHRRRTRHEPSGRMGAVASRHRRGHRGRPSPSRRTASPSGQTTREDP